MLEILALNKYNSIRQLKRAINSAVECHLHTVEVVGSNPISPTKPISGVSELFRGPLMFYLDLRMRRKDETGYPRSVQKCG